jgi:hypothetical protein
LEEEVTALSSTIGVTGSEDHPPAAATVTTVTGCEVDVSGIVTYSSIEVDVTGR